MAEIQCLGKRGKFLGDALKARLVVIYPIHFIHGQHDVLDAYEVAQIGMTAGLGEDALSRVNQYDRQPCC